MTPEPRCVWELQATLGEGPIWLGRDNAVWFVDIMSRRLHRFHPESGARESFALDGRPSFVVPASDGELVVGAESAILRLDRSGGVLGEIATLDQPATNRTNDATVDGAGRLWISTMDDAEQQPTGTVWCLEHGKLHRAGTQAPVINGPAVTADLQYLYHVDTPARTITRFPLGGDLSLTDGKVIVRLDEDEGHPDGIVLDAEECLWVALFGGWGVRRYAPDGTLLLHVPLPCANVTKLAFGGPDLKTAYVTTARKGLTADALAGQPLAGGLFTFPAPVAGRELPAVRLA